MEVIVQVHKSLKKYFNLTGDIKLNLRDNSTVTDLLKVIETELHVKIFNGITSEVELRRNFIVTINGRLAYLSDKIEAETKNIKILPPISGG